MSHAPVLFRIQVFSLTFHVQLLHALIVFPNDYVPPLLLKTVHDVVLEEEVPELRLVVPAGGSLYDLFLPRFFFVMLSMIAGAVNTSFTQT